MGLRQFEEDSFFFLGCILLLLLYRRPHLGRIEIQHCGDIPANALLSRMPLAGCNSVRREFIMTPTRA
jgi:hypothetical protein